MSEFACRVLYDSECSLCNRFKKAIELIDTKKQVEFKSLYDPKVYVDYPELSEQRCLETLHLITSENEILEGPDAMSFLIKLLPGVKKFSWLMDSNSAKKASKAFYKRLNEMRIMKKRNCFTCGRPSMRKRNE